MKVDKTNAVRVNIPAYVRDILNLHPKDIIVWDVNEENKIVTIKKVE